MKKKKSELQGKTNWNNMQPPSHIHQKQCAIDTVLQHEYES